jgi:hypothetical protein
MLSASERGNSEVSMLGVQSDASSAGGEFDRIISVSERSNWQVARLGVHSNVCSISVVGVSKVPSASSLLQRNDQWSASIAERGRPVVRLGMSKEGEDPRLITGSVFGVELGTRSGRQAESSGQGSASNARVECPRKLCVAGIQSAGWRSGGSGSGTESARVDDEEVAVSFAVGGVESALEWTGEVSPGERAAKDWSSIIFAIIAIRTIEQ